MTALTPDQEAIARRTAELVLSQLADREPPESLTADMAMRLLSCDSHSALYRELEDLGVRPYRKGKFRRHDLINAVARRAHAVHQAHKRAQAA